MDYDTKLKYYLYRLPKNGILIDDVISVLHEYCDKYVDICWNYLYYEGKSNSDKKYLEQSDDGYYNNEYYNNSEYYNDFEYEYNKINGFEKIFTADIKHNGDKYIIHKCLYENKWIDNPSNGDIIRYAHMSHFLHILYDYFTKIKINNTYNSTFIFDESYTIKNIEDNIKNGATDIQITDIIKFNHAFFIDLNLIKNIYSCDYYNNLFTLESTYSDVYNFINYHSI